MINKQIASTQEHFIAESMSESDALAWVRGDIISRKILEGGNVLQTTKVYEDPDKGTETFFHAALEYVKGTTSKNGRSRLLQLVSYIEETITLPKTELATSAPALQP